MDFEKITDRRMVMSEVFANIFLIGAVGIIFFGVPTTSFWESSASKAFWPFAILFMLSAVSCFVGAIGYIWA